MPTYEYRCGACGHEFERFQAMSDPPIRECPECGEEAAERLISPGAGLVFKGPGFYATDYRGGNGGDADRDESGAAKEDAGASDGGSEESAAEDDGG